MILFLFTSCADGGASMDSSTYNGGSGYKSESSDFTPSENDMESDGKETDVSEAERKIIKTYRLRMETLSYDSAVNQITAAAQSFGGYVAEASQDGQGISESSYQTRSATFTIRVPADKAEAFLAYISEGQNVLSSSLYTEDVTDSYYGYKARLDSLVVQEERLMAMMEKAETLSELLQLEDKLSEVRAEINGISSRLQLMDKSVDYSYVYITLNEVKEYKEPEKESYFSRMVASFGDAFASFAEVVGEVFIAFIWVLPYVIVVGVIALVVILILTRDRRRRKKETEQKEEETSEP